MMNQSSRVSFVSGPIPLRPIGTLTVVLTRNHYTQKVPTTIFLTTGNFSLLDQEMFVLVRISPWRSQFTGEYPSFQRCHFVFVICFWSSGSRVYTDKTVLLVFGRVKWRRKTTKNQVRIKWRRLGKLYTSCRDIGTKRKIGENQKGQDERKKKISGDY